MVTASTHRNLLNDCRLCPRNCGVDRSQGPTGFCRIGAELAVAAVVCHQGEEPVLGGEQGICNVFFAHCNLRCVYCQNVQISRNSSLISLGKSPATVLDEITALLAGGLTHLGFVSPSHMVPQMLFILEELRRRGHRPVVVYNTNGYDSVATLQMLDEWVDIYLPDCKYMDGDLARRYSGAADYPEVAAKALAEMFRQRGKLLHLDEKGRALRGMLVRHLILPGELANTKAVLHFLADSLSNRIHLSLMAQYYPIAGLPAKSPLNRGLTAAEYHAALAEMEALGFTEGWVQDLRGAEFYRPDFSQAQPFAASQVTAVAEEQDQKRAG